jgi:hypothetical protein
MFGFYTTPIRGMTGAQRANISIAHFRPFYSSFLCAPYFCRPLVSFFVPSFVSFFFAFLRHFLLGDFMGAVPLYLFYFLAVRRFPFIFYTLFGLYMRPIRGMTGAQSANLDIVHIATHYFNTFFVLFRF